MLLIRRFLLFVFAGILALIEAVNASELYTTPFRDTPARMGTEAKTEVYSVQKNPPLIGKEYLFLDSGDQYSFIVPSRALEYGKIKSALYQTSPLREGDIDVLYDVARGNTRVKFKKLRTVLKKIGAVSCHRGSHWKVSFYGSSIVAPLLCPHPNTTMSLLGLQLMWRALKKAGFRCIKL